MFNPRQYFALQHRLMFIHRVHIAIIKTGRLNYAKYCYILIIKIIIATLVCLY